MKPAVLAVALLFAANRAVGDSTIDPAATVEYVRAYREMWDSDASAEASS